MNVENNWKGLIGFVLLFRGSKSESVYPVLECDNGHRYRLRLIGSSSLDTSKYLSTFEGQRVAIQGIADKIRGHRRLSIDRLDVMSDSDSDQISIESLPESPESTLLPKKNNDGAL